MNLLAAIVIAAWAAWVLGRLTAVIYAIWARR